MRLRRLQFMKLRVLQYALNSANGTPVPGFLIEHPQAGPILVDTGFPPGESVQSLPSSQLILKMDNVQYQLQTAGYSIGDIKHLIFTHLDPDHAGSAGLFPNAKKYIQREHLEAAKSGRFERLERSRPSWDQADAQWVELDGNTELFQGVTVIETPGHVPGHQSILVDLKNTGLCLITGDAVMTAESLEQDTEIALDMDSEQAIQTRRDINELIRSRGIKLVLYGHSAAQWKELRLNPEFYD